MLQILAQDLERCAQSYLETHHRGTVTANQGERSPATAQNWHSIAVPNFEQGLCICWSFCPIFTFLENKTCGNICFKKKHFMGSHLLPLLVGMTEK